MIKTTLQGTAEAVTQGTAIKPYVALNKLLFTHLQQIAIAASFPMKWPKLLLRMFSVFDSSASISQELVSLDCFRGNVPAFELGVFTQLLLPVVIAALLGIVWLAVATCRTHCKREASEAKQAEAIEQGIKLKIPGRVRLSSDGVDTVELPGAVHADQENPLKKQQGTDTPNSNAASAGWVKLSNKRKSVVHLSTQLRQGVQPSTGFVVSLLVSSFLLHLSLTKTALSALTCVDLAPGHSYLLGDLDIACGTAEWRPLAIIGVLGLVLYGLGVPFGGFWVLWRNRSELQRAHIKARYGFLYMQYRPEMWFWETITLLRKVALAVIAVLLATQGIGVQVMCSIVLLVASLVVHLVAAPHVDKRLNMLEAASLVVAVATLAGGAVLVDDSAPEGWAVVCSVGIVLLNAAFIATACVGLVWLVLQDASVRQKASTSLWRLKSSVLFAKSAPKKDKQSELAAEVADEPGATPNKMYFSPLKPPGRLFHVSRSARKLEKP